MDKKVIRIIRLLFLISLIISVIVVTNTYSKYQEKIGTTYSVKMKGWKLKINDNDISNTETFSEVLEPIWDNDDSIKNHVASGKFVPGAEQYLLIEIDYSEVGVMFSVDIDIKQTSSNTLEFFDVEGYTYGSLENYVSTVNDVKNDITALTVEENEDSVKTYKIHEVIDAPNLEEKVKYIKVYLGWNDDAKDGNVTINNELIKKNKYDTNYIKNEVVENIAGNLVNETTQTHVVYEAKAVFTQILY